MSKMIPHSRPTLGKEEAEAVSAVVSSGHIAQGPKVKEFEEKLAEFFGVKGAVATSSGTSALHLGLLAIGVEKEDEVILPSYVCTAPLNAVYHSGAKPSVCDIELESFNLSADGMLSAKTENSKAVIVPHMFGNVADIEGIESSALPVIEDCAQAIGAVYGKKKAGSLGKLSICSFYANKMMASGEGGCLLSDDEDILRFASDRRDYDERDTYKVRYNYKMSDLEAAVGIIQLDKLPGFIASRRAIAEKYNKAFKDLPIILPASEFDHIYYRYVVRAEGDVSKVIRLLRESGVTACRPVFRPLNRCLDMRSGFINTEQAYSQAISIPIYPSLTEEEQDRVIEAVKEAIA